MNKLAEKAISIVEETVEFYKNNPRATNELGTCKYLTEDGKKCAIGRKLNKKQLEIVHLHCEELGADDVMQTLNIKTLHGLGVSFWESLQRIHDDASCWETTKAGTKLTAAGKTGVKQLVEKIKLKTVKELKGDDW